MKGVSAKAVFLLSLFVTVAGCEKCKTKPAKSGSIQTETTEPQSADAGEPNYSFAPPTAMIPENKVVVQAPNENYAENIGSVPPHSAHPAYAPAAKRIVFQAGPEGSRSIYEQSLEDQTNIRRLTRGADDIHPTYDRAGNRIVFSRKTKTGKYFDLHVLHRDSGKIEQLTFGEGDDLEPHVNRMLFRMMAGDLPLDEYEKIAFTRRTKQGRSVWFRSLPYDSYPREVLIPWGDEPKKWVGQGLHSGRMSPLEEDCWSPRWADDGQHLLWICGDESTPQLTDMKLSMDLIEKQAIKSMENYWDCELEDKPWFEQDCLMKLSRSYYSAIPKDLRAIPKSSSGTYSTNQINVIVSDGEVAKMRRRNGRVMAQLALPKGSRPEHLVWSPDGLTVAFTEQTSSGTQVRVSEVDTYLQEVRNLYQFPELWRESDSSRLHANRFVVRPTQEKEFYPVYERLRYDRQPIYITADVALQVFADVFEDRMKHGERSNGERLLELTSALHRHYFEHPEAKHSQYFQTHFAVAYALLRAAEQLYPIRDTDSHDNFQRADLSDGENLFDGALSVVKSLSGNTEKATEILAGMKTGSCARLIVPTYPAPVTIDCTQMKPRASYVGRIASGYFAAVQWLAQAPLPYGDGSALELINVLEWDGGWHDWLALDAFIGAFGKAADPTLVHLKSHYGKSPEDWTFGNSESIERGIVEPQMKLLETTDSLEKMPSTVRPRLVFLAQRVGADAVVMQKMTAPKVPDRSFPSAVDPFAWSGSQRALKHSLASSQKVEPSELEASFKALRESMPPSAEKGDFYHRWLALLFDLSMYHEAMTGPRHTRSTAWSDRLLLSSLASYTHLKHASVLYTKQPYGSEKGEGDGFNRLSEAIVIPKPRGYVEPVPKFFQALQRLHKASIEEMGSSLEYDEWTTKFFERLIELAEKSVANEEYTDEEYEWVREVGGQLEGFLFAKYGEDNIDPVRVERGVAVVADVFTNIYENEVWQIGNGRLQDIWVVAETGVGERIAKGAIQSFYEFKQPTANRLTDEEWNSMLNEGSVSAPPKWTSSFVEY